MANKLTDEQFYAQMDKIKQLSGFNPFEGFADELYKQVGNQNPVSAFINNFSPEARAQIMQPMEQQVQQMPEVPYTNDGTFQSLAGSSQTGGHDIYSGSDPTDYGVAGGEQVSNMDKWVAENAVGGMNILAQPEKLASGLLDIGSGYYQKATGDITNQEQVDLANNTTQQFQEMFTPKGLHKGPDALGLAAGGTYLAGKAGGWAGNKLESSGINDKIDAIVNDNPGLFPTELGGKSEVVGKSKDMRDISPQYATLPYRVDELEKIKNLTTETTDNQLIDVPEVSIVDLEGKPFALGMSDRTEAGKTLTTVNDIELNEGVPLRGGQNYMRNAENYLQGNVWASAPSAVSGILNHAKKAKGDSTENPLFLPWSMQPTGNDFSHQTVEVMINMADTVLNRKQKSALNNEIKKIVPSWKGIGSSKLAEVLNNTTGAERKAMLKVLDRDFRDFGLSLPEARVAVSDVDQLNMPQSSLMNVGLLDLERSDFPNHPTYAQALKGDVVGRLKENISAFDLLDADNPFMVARGKNVSGDNFDSDAVTSLRWKGAGGVITDKILRQLEDKGLLGQIDTPKKDNRSAVPEIKSQTGKETKPVTVYHGTNKEFDELDPRMSGTNQGFDEQGAMFFTTDKDRAPRFSKDYPNKAKYKYTDEDKVAVEKANSLVKEVKLDESNALTMSEVKELYEQGKIKTKPNTKDLFRAESAWDNNREAIKQASDVTGKKVFKHTAEGETQYAVFDTNKISYNNPSKVDDGLLKQEPLIVYRSSTSGGYDKFDKSKQRTSTLGKGVYMFKDEKGASDWVGENLQKIELPYDYMEKSINWGDGGQSDFITKAFKKIEKEVDFKLDLEDDGIDVYPELVDKLGTDKAQALLLKHGIYGNRRDGELTTFNVDDAKIISTDKKKPKKGLLD